jgi:hypothetical protein
MTSTRYTVAAVVSLVGGGLAILLQYLVTPLSDGDLDGAELLDRVAAHHTAMGWALVLDVPALARRMGHFFTAGREGDAHPFPEPTTRERDVLDLLADGIPTPTSRPRSAFRRRPSATTSPTSSPSCW